MAIWRTASVFFIGTGQLIHDVVLMTQVGLVVEDGARADRGGVEVGGAASPPTTPAGRPSSAATSARTSPTTEPVAHQGRELVGRRRRPGATRTGS